MQRPTNPNEVMRIAKVTIWMYWGFVMLNSLINISGYTKKRAEMGTLTIRSCLIDFLIIYFTALKSISL